MESLGLLNYALSKFEIEVACQELFRSLKKVVKRILMFRQTVGWELKRSGRLILPWLNISQFMRKKIKIVEQPFCITNPEIIINLYERTGFPRKSDVSKYRFDRSLPGQRQWKWALEKLNVGL